MRWLAIVVLGIGTACVSSGAPGEGGSGDGGPAAGGRRDGGAPPAAAPEAGTNPDAGRGPPPADAGPGAVAVADGGTGDGGADLITCGAVDLAGRYEGTFAGSVWWNSQPGNREPVSGTVSFDLVCQGVKYGVTGTMTGAESHAVVFSAQIRGEVVPAQSPVMNASFMGEATFTALGGGRVPFAGTMQGELVGTRITGGTWQGHSTTALVPASGEGTWQAARRP